jgi:hypothetical protein
MLDEIAPELAPCRRLDEVVSARLPMAAAEAGRVHIFRPDDGGDEHYAIEIGRPTATSRCWRGCIRPASPATCWGR